MMMKVMFAWCFLIIILMKQADATPLPDQVNEDPEEETNVQLPDGDVLMGGDMIFNKEEVQDAEADALTKQAASVDSQREMGNHVTKWPGNTLYYDLSKVSGWWDHPNSIREALEDLQKKLNSCITFKESTTAKNRVKVTGKKNGCRSYEGMQPSNKQPQNLNLKFSTFGATCRKKGTIQHEFLHALGFFHTQMRSDRDKFVTVYKDNVQPGQYAQNFGKYNEILVKKLVKFDYGSVMMYPQKAFSVSGNLITIKTDDPKWQKKIGQRDGVSARDVEMVRKAYGCE